MEIGIKILRKCKIKKIKQATEKKKGVGREIKIDLNDIL